MKKLFVSFLCAALVIGAAGCGNAKDSTSQATQTTTTSNTTNTSTDSEENASLSVEAADSWEVEGLTFLVPSYWNEIDAGSGNQIDSIASTLKTTYEAAETTTGCELDENAYAALSELCGLEETTTNNNSFEWEDIISNLGMPDYSMIYTLSVSGDIHKDYEKGHYSYIVYCTYTIDENLCLFIWYQEPIVGKNPNWEENYTLDTQGIILSSKDYFQSEFIDSKISDESPFFNLLDEKGSF